MRLISVSVNAHAPPINKIVETNTHFARHDFTRKSESDLLLYVADVRATAQTPAASSSESMRRACPGLIPARITAF